MANKKINQLVLKTTIQSTDLFPLGDATTGQLFKKTIAELQAAIGGAVISVNGLVGTVVLDTDDIQELGGATNRYFTDARARGAISLTVAGNSGASTYNSSTGVLNVPTYTLAGLGGITASFLSGASGIAYNSSTGVITYTGTVFTDASIRALLSAGAGLSYNSSTGVFSYSGTVFTDASIRALISLTTSGTSGVSTYNNTTGVLNVPNYTLVGLGGITLASLSGSAPITYNSSTGAIGITQASGSSDGFLSSTDFTTFNGKQSALTLGNLTEATSSVLTITGGTGAVVGSGTSIQVKQASTSVSGFLSSNDFSTFNSKQGTITLTTTGTSGASTFSGGTLNIPQYQGLLTNPVTGTGTTNFVTKWTSSSAIGNSQIFDNGTSVGIGTNSTGFNTAGLPLIVGSGTGNTGMTIFSGSTSFGSIHFADAVTTGNASFSGFINYDHTGNSMQFGTANTERMRITSAGNVGIGTSSPSSFSGYNNLSLQGLSNGYNLDFYNNSGARKAEIVYNTGTNFIIGSLESIPMVLETAGVERMRILSNGNINITGTIVMGQQLTISNTTNSYATMNLGAGSSYGWQIGKADNSGDIATSNGFYIHSILNGATRLCITGGGNILLGTTTDNGERLFVSGSIRATGSITANSDARLKKNIERIQNALEKVGQISGYTYNTIYDEDRHAGVIAQEIDKVLPEIVNKGNDGLMGVEYGNISALLIEAIKEQKVLIESLQAKVEALSK